MDELTVEFLWVPQCLGGHGAEPFEGMRTTIRWQRFLYESMQNAQDAEWSNIVYLSESQQGKAVCTLKAPELTPDNVDPAGEFVEFLSGYRVIAIGRVQKK